MSWLLCMRLVSGRGGIAPDVRWLACLAWCSRRSHATFVSAWDADGVAGIALATAPSG